LFPKLNSIKRLPSKVLKKASNFRKACKESVAESKGKLKYVKALKPLWYKWDVSAERKMSFLNNAFFVVAFLNVWLMLQLVNAKDFIGLPVFITMMIYAVIAGYLGSKVGLKAGLLGEALFVMFLVGVNQWAIAGLPWGMFPPTQLTLSLINVNTLCLANFLMITTWVIAGDA
jgi:hypothetical protein